MANDTYKRAPGRGKFALFGVDLVHPPDLMPQGKAPYLLNVIASRQQGVLQARSGTTVVNSVALDQTNVHSLIRVNNSVPAASPAWARFVGAGTKLYSGQTTFTSRGTGYSGNPLALVAMRPPNAPDPYLYVYDSTKQRKYNVAGSEYAIGVPAPPEPTITQTAPVVKDLGQYTSTTGWTAANAAGSLATAQRVPTGTTITSILYDVGSTGWCNILPSNTAFAGQATVRPTTSVNGWAANAHVGAYEMGTDQAHGWGLSSDTTNGYTTPDAAVDGSLSTYATRGWKGNHNYAGCIWTFSGVTTTLGTYLNILSWIPSNYGVNKRSAGIWYSTDGGTTWNNVYDAATKDLGWDSVLLPGGIAYSQIQVMAFLDAHDDMVHYVYDINMSGSPHNSAYSVGGRLLVGAETVTTTQLFSALPSTTVQAVSYDAAGIATVQPTLSVPGIERNRVVVINGSNTRVLDVTRGLDDNFSFRVKLAGIVAAHTITCPVNFRTYAANTHAAAEGISSGLIAAQFTPSSVGTAVGVVSYALTADLTQAGSRPLTKDDYMHVSLRFSSPANVVECHVMVDVDNTTNDFTGNYYYYVIRQNDFQQVATGTQSTTDSLIAQVTNQVAVSYNQGGEPGELPLGDSQYLEATLRINDLIRVGSDSTVNLSGVKAIGIRVIVDGATTMQFGSWWVGGTYGPDANYNSSGNQGTPIIYRYRYRSSTNGTISNPSPATRGSEVPLRNGINVSVTASTDSQIDLIDIERNGGTFDTWHQALTVPNTTATVTDDVKETVAFASDPLDILQYQPWPVTDKPRTATCNIVGTRVSATSGTPFNVAWVPGTAVIIGNKTYTLYAPPESTTVMTLAQNAPNQSGVTVRIPEATIVGQPLPYACLGPDGRVFATGDPLNPGLLYFTNPYSPDTASDRGYIEITNPSEPLGPPRYFEGAIYVRSTESLYRVDPTPGQANPYGYYKLGNAPGIGSNFALTRDGDIALGPDGIYEFNGTSAQNITQQDLLPLFPNEGKPGTAVLVSGRTIYPPDYNQPTKLRLALAGDFLYFDYIDTQGTYWTLALARETKGWVFYKYSVSDAGIHYEEEGINSPVTLIGHQDGFVTYISSTLNDRGTNFTCRVVTPADDQGETRARKQYGDLMLDYGGIAAGSSAPGSGGTGGDVVSSGTGGGLNDPVTLGNFVGLDIGTVDPGAGPGSLSVTSSTATVSGGSFPLDNGNNTSDSFFFAYVRRNGPVTLTARMTTKSNLGLVGIMFRSSLAPTSLNFLLGPESEDWLGYSTIAMSSRPFGSTLGNQWAFTVSSGGVVTGTGYSPSVPIWFRLQYALTGLCNGYFSKNGTTWTTVFTNQQLTAGNTPIYLGLVSASAWLAQCAVVWDNISVTFP